LPTARALADGLKQVKANLQTIKTEENIEKVKIAIAEVLVQIEKIFEIKKTVIQNQRQNQAFTLDATEIKIKLENAVRELAEVDNQLASIAHAQELLQKSSESYYDMFRNATAALTKAKDQHDANQTALQQTEFEIERYQMRCQELEKIIEQAGRTMKEFERVEITPIPEDEFRIIEQKIFRLRADLTTMGEVDEAVVKEARETAERYDFLTKEASDLVQAIQDLNALIKELVEKMKTEFTQALTHINREFNHFFELMFGGGSAHLVQSAPRNPKQNQTQEQLGEIEESSEGEVEETGIEVSLSFHASESPASMCSREVSEVWWELPPFSPSFQFLHRHF
jgi:chromosome segregation protein